MSILTRYQKFCEKTDENAHEHHLVYGLLGEAGEIARLYQRYYRGGCLIIGDLHNNIIDELGDVLWYVTELASFYSCDLETLMVRNMDKLTKRIENGKDNENSD